MTQRILQVLPRLDSSGGGVQRGTMDLAGALVKAGWTSMVASAGGDHVPGLVRGGSQHFTLPLASKNPWRMWRNAAALARLIRQHNIDLVHARSRAPAWSAYWACRRTGVPLVTTFHGSYNHQHRLKRRYNAVMTFGQRVIAISGYIRDHIQQIYGTNPAKIRVIQRGVNLDHFDPAKVAAGRMVQLAKEWQLPDGAAVIMLPGRLTRWKGQLLLLQALARLNRPDVCTLLVGDDEGRTAYRQELQQHLNDLGLSAQVKLVGRCQDMPAAYRLADVVVVPSLDPEAFGRTMAEGLAMGCLVVAADHGAAPEVLAQGQYGWLFTPGDAEALAAALAKALSLSGNERLSMATTNQAYVAQHFSLKDMAAQTLNVYQELLNPLA
ncbi:MAG: glycosyltransferase family 4 protein [Alphaproteobacteria bacterium]|nr:glycosyltransferase family 4 protein [Alphaproteobacteria bacterium]